jgi:hypothetical protein
MPYADIEKRRACVRDAVARHRVSKNVLEKRAAFLEDFNTLCAVIEPGTLNACAAGLHRVGRYTTGMWCMCCGERLGETIWGFS